MPFFSVIIPLYNKQRFIEAALQSIFAQTFTGYEIIIVDDVSTDNSLEIAEKFASENVKIIKHTVNKGLSASRNTGIKYASSDYVAFLDADDLWKPQYLAKIFFLIQQYPSAGLFATNYEELYPNNVVVETNTNLKNSHDDGILADFFENSLKQPIYCSCSLTVMKSVFENVGYFDEKITFGEDVDFNIRANQAYKLAYSKETLVTYRIFSEHQITRSTFGNKIITDFDYYEPTENSSLKRYLDVNRYIMARHYKLEGNTEKFKKMLIGMNTQNLNSRQRFLLSVPAFVDATLKKAKVFLLKKGIRVTTFR